MTTSETQADVFEMTDARWKLLRKSGDATKHRYGHAAIVSDPSGQGGAAQMAVCGALRIGAGAVSVICSADAVAERAAQLNAIMIKQYFTEVGSLDRLTAIKPQAICIGPNLGLASASQNLLSHTLSFGLPMGIDADAITLMADASVTLPNVSNPQSVLTR